MPEDGWVKNFRKIKEWEWYKKPGMAHLFQHLIREANHRDGRWEGHEIKRGQIITGRNKLAEETGLSPQQIRTCLSRLQETAELTIKSTNKFSIITIRNYEQYQANEKQINQDINQQSTSNQPAINHKQECKNKKNTPLEGNHKCPYGEILALYHTILPELPATQKLTDKRKSQLKARWHESDKTSSLNWWKEYFEYVRQSHFLLGENQRGWKADLEWLTKESHFVSILEGKYHALRPMQ